MPMTEADVLRTHEQAFYGALKARDFRSLSTLYADDYMLVRPDGSVLSKHGVLRDLEDGGLTFRDIELTDVSVRIHGDTALLTGESRTVTSRDGKEATARFRLVAVYVARAGRLQPAHFQSVALPVDSESNAKRTAPVVGCPPTKTEAPC